MGSRLALTWLCVALLAAAAWAGEESRFLGEAGLPAPLSPLWDVEMQDVRVHIVFPRPGGSNVATVRAALTAQYYGKEPVEVEVGFPVVWPFMPAFDQPSSNPVESWRPATAVKLDGKPVPTKLLFYADLAEPRVAGWTAEIARLLGHLPQMYEPDHRAELWRKGGEWALQQRLAELDPQYEPVDLYEELSEEWGHAALMLGPLNGQLGRSYNMSGPGPFGAVAFPVVFQPRTPHTLVVQHKQPLGREVNHYSSPPHATTFVALRYVLTRATTWGWGPGEITIDITVPDGWGKVVARPPATETSPAKGGTTHRITMWNSPFEELYISVMSPRR